MAWLQLQVSTWEHFVIPQRELPTNFDSYAGGRLQQFRFTKAKDANSMVWPFTSCGTYGKKEIEESFFFLKRIQESLKTSIAL